MRKISVVGIDIAKTVFQAEARDERGAVVFKRKLYRSQMGEFLAQLEPTVIAMEACGGSHYWGREAERFGHEVRILPGEAVASYVYAHKSNQIDAAAIAEATGNERVKSVAVKSIEQQDLQMRVRVRQRLVETATKVANEIHGFLLEYGVLIPRSMKNMNANVSEALEKAGDKLTASGRSTLRNLVAELGDLQKRIKTITDALTKEMKEHQVGQRLATIPGVGTITAATLLAAVGDPGRFKNGRQLAAWIGLVPRQNSTGEDYKLGHITKRGNSYLRALFVQGANATVTAAIRFHKKKEPARRVVWMRDLLQRCGRQKTVVATANKTARIAWAIMANREAVYDQNFSARAA